MLVGDLVYNDIFDFNANYEIWKGLHHDESGELIWSTFKNGYVKPLDRILDMEIEYITTDTKNGTVIIEAK